MSNQKPGHSEHDINRMKRPCKQEGNEMTEME